MQKSTKTEKIAVRRGPGRPATGRDPMIGGRVPQATIDALDAWAEANGLTRSAALAPIVEAGLKAKARSRARKS